MTSPRSSSVLVLTALLLGSACAKEPSDAPARPTPPPATATPTPAPASPSADPEAVALERAREAAMTLGRTLKGRLLAALAESGPVGALEVCATEAQTRTGEVGRQADARVGRSSLRLRNPANAGPAWVREALSSLGERPASGVTPIRVVADVEGRRVARFAAPIPVEGPCLTCHGARESLAPELRQALARRYPEDAAVGYAVGDLRGLVWAEVDVP